MIIRKKFKFEASHIVRNCSTERCSKTIHGHSYIVEVFLSSCHLDNGGMVVDFSLLKGYIKDVIDSFDHSLLIWGRESDEFKKDMKKYSSRIIELPLTSSAECLSIQLFYLIEKIIKNTRFRNNEDVDLKVSSVRVHETETGYAEACKEDIPYNILKIEMFSFSNSIKNDWGDFNMIEKIIEGETFLNPEPFKQI